MRHKSKRRCTMLYPLILWLLGVPVVLIIILMLFGIV
jgi:heme/copper-type cytochrome/quinol oxidase subunit 1